MRQRWGLAVFALPFAGIGVGMLVFAVIPVLVDGVRVQSWHQADARLTSVTLDVNHGDDSTTYRARATYVYEYRGREYHGSRVGIDDGSDSIGDFQQTLARHLEQAYQRNQPVPVWINPERPEQALLNRDIRWGMVGFYMVFVLVFGGVGVGMLCYVLLSDRGRVEHAEAGDKPWLTRSEWFGPDIRSSARTSMWVAWCIGGLWNVISLPAGIIGTQEFLSGNTPAILALLFPLVGIGLLIWAAKITANWRRFGRTPLTMDPYPGAIGGQVGGTMEVKLPYDPRHAFKATLSCIYSYMSGSGKNRNRSERLIWQSEGFAHARPHLSNTRLEMLFDVEDDLPASDAEGSSYHLWRLQVSAALPGTDFERTFEIPVFPTSESARQLRELSTEHRLAGEHRMQAIERVLDVRQIPGGVELYYPAWRNPGNKLAALLFGTIFVAAGIFIGQSGGPAVFPIAFGTIGGLITLVAAYSLVVSLHVRIDRDGLRTRRRLLGIPAGGQKVARPDIRGLALKHSYSFSGADKKHTAYYKLKAVTQAGKSYTIGYNLAGREVAQEALESLSLLTGLPVEELETRRRVRNAGIP